jgi:hypothetical protein
MNPTKNRGELVYPGRVGSYCSNSGTRRVNLVMNEGSVYDKWNISVTVCDTDIHNGQPSHAGERKTFEMTTSTLN